MHILLQYNIYIFNFNVMALGTTRVAGFRLFRIWKRVFLFIYFWLCKEPRKNPI